ncbi:hypothetical protein VVD49_02585 [Uliginosibacterium sp. H3]|uniref:Outer membrane protein assembly factor BamE n=1 Tax=Uliginosibacterium silvisoli TaxID=3114758 RepID=A0ABU6JYV3_9RHOO|nr:hypothetical protein [Uliginosibacterium sp. H3]
MPLRQLVLCALLICLGACASVERIASLAPGTSTEADATKAAGRRPEYVWNNADGTRTLDYSNQPFEGTTSWFVTVDAAGKILKTQRIEVNAERNDVSIGMTPDQIRRMLGSPRTVTTYMSGEEVWDWNTVTVGGPGYLVRFNVHFKDGKVVRTSTKTIDRNDCRMFFC